MKKILAFSLAALLAVTSFSLSPVNTASEAQIEVAGDEDLPHCG